MRHFTNWLLEIPVCSEVPEWVLLWCLGSSHRMHVFWLTYTVLWGNSANHCVARIQGKKRVLYGLNKHFILNWFHFLIIYIFQCKKKRKAPKLRHHSHETVVNGDNQPVKQSKTPELSEMLGCVHIQKDHLYYTSDSPRSIKRKNWPMHVTSCAVWRNGSSTHNRNQDVSLTGLIHWKPLSSRFRSKHSCGFVIGFFSWIHLVVFHGF